MKLADNTLIIDQQTDFSFEDVQDSTYYYSFHDSLPAISPGDIIMDKTGPGHLRKIVSFEIQDTIVIIETEFATLTDAIEACALDTTIRVQIGTPGSAKQMGIEAYESDSSVVVVDSVIEFHNKVIFEGNIEGADVCVTIPQGYISFNPDIDIQMTIMESELTRFRFLVTGHLGAAFDMDVTCSDSFQFSNRITVISIPLPSITVDPMVFTPTLSFDVGFDADIEFGGDLMSGCETDDSVSIGAAYEDQGWSCVKEIDEEFIAHPIDWDGNADAELRGYVLPSITVEIYSVAGPHIEVGPCFQLSGRAGQPCSECYLSAEVDGQMHFPGQILEWQLADYDTEFSFVSYIIAETTNCNFPTAVFTVDPDTGNIWTQFQVDATDCYDDKHSSSALEVRWDWEDDGTYDTDWSITKRASHQYLTTGDKTIKLEVKDTEGLMDTETHQVTVDFPRCGTVADIDGNTYQTVQIGNQCWMAENLEVTHYRNGDLIPNVTDDTAWANLTTGAYCNCNNDVNNVVTYGRLYNWYAVDDSHDIAPEGWHVPSDAEWQVLVDYLGADAVAGAKMKTAGTIEGGDGLWYSPNTGVTNESGFSALPGGNRYCTGGFGSLGHDALFWSSTENDSNTARGPGLNSGSSAVNRDGRDKRDGFSVRFVRDTDENTPPAASFTVNPISGTTNAVFNVDASASSDDQDPTSALQVRWDWEDDGTYDTNWTTTKTASHQYSTPGTKTIKLEVKDTGEWTDAGTHQVTVYSYSGCGTVTDIDDNTYQTIQIGSQCWMAENLKVTHYRNGDAIPNVIDGTEWTWLGTGAYCNYSNDAGYVATYGRLYNWYAVHDSHDIAPEGWHVSSDAEWKQLEMYLGMSQSQADSTGWRGTDEGGKLKETGTSHWYGPNTGATNESGFSALPAGYRYIYDGSFQFLGEFAGFWSSTVYYSDWAWVRVFYHDHSGVARGDQTKQSGHSVRCLKD